MASYFRVFLLLNSEGTEGKQRAVERRTGERDGSCDRGERPKVAMDYRGKGRLRARGNAGCDWWDSWTGVGGKWIVDSWRNVNG